MTKTVAVLGSTGSIGRQTLQVVQELGLTVAALTANRQVDLLEQQARQLHPKLAVLYDRAAAGELRLRLSDTDIRVAAGPEGRWSPPSWAALDWNPRWRLSGRKSASLWPIRRRWCAPASW